MHLPSHRTQKLGDKEWLPHIAQYTGEHLDAEECWSEKIQLKPGRSQWNATH